MTIFDTPLQTEQIQIPDYIGGQNRAIEAKQSQQINQANLQKYHEDQIKARRENQRAAAVNQLSQLSLTNADAMAQLAQIDPDRAKKNVEFLYERSAAAGSYASTVLLAPREITAKVYKHVIKEAKNDPRIDQQALAEFPDEYTPDLDAKLYAVAQGHRKLEDGLKAHQEAATLAETQAKTLGATAQTKTEGFKQANYASEIAKRKVETENARLGKGKEPPQGFRWKADGNLEKIPGGPADKLSGEAATKLTIASDALSSLKDLRKQLFQTDPKTGAEVLQKNYSHKLGGAAFLPNFTQSKETQRTELARTNVSDLIGRLRSGAVVGPEEEKRFRQLIPRYGDKPETIAYKMKELDRSFAQLKSGITGDPIESNQDSPQRLKYNPETGTVE